MKKIPVKSRQEMLEILKKATKQPQKKKPTKQAYVTLFILAIILSVFYVNFYNNSERENIETKTGLNTVVSQYLSGMYQEFVVDGETLYAKKPPRQETIGNKTIQVIDVDKVKLPTKDGLKDL